MRTGAAESMLVALQRNLTLANRHVAPLTVADLEIDALDQRIRQGPHGLRLSPVEHILLAANDLAHVVGRNRSATSQHLRVLRELGAIVAQRKGNVVRYTHSNDPSGSIIEDATSAFDQLQPSTAGATG